MTATRPRAAQWQPGASREYLKRRSQCLHALRDYFHRHDVLEVTTPVLLDAASCEPNLKNFSLPTGDSVAYLRSSPESSLKRLLAADFGDLYEIGPVFRDEEHGRLHQCEFTLLEWYRVGFDHHQLMDEVCEVLRAVGYPKHPQRISYGALFEGVMGAQPERLSNRQLAETLETVTLGVGDEDDRALLLDAIYAQYLEPELARLGAVLLYDFLPEQRAYARLNPGPPVRAERFELIIDGLELANGYHEITDPLDQQRCFERELAVRARRGLPSVEPDANWLEALHSGMPNCAGVALGIERLLLAITDASTINEVQAFAR